MSSRSSLRRTPTSRLLPGKVPPDVLGPLIERYGAKDSNVVVGPGLGRDAAAITVPTGMVVVKSDPITFPTERPGAHLVNVNANDLACLGAIPRYLLVTALFPEHGTTPQLVEDQFADLYEAGQAIGVSLVGGHCEVTVGLDRPILIGSMIGEATRDTLLEPGKARVGDVLLLTKALAIEGTAILVRERERELAGRVPPEVMQHARNFLREPGISVVRDARVVIDAGGVTALHDPTEGGLATGVRELAEAAGCGARLHLPVPVTAATQAICTVLGIDPLGLLASGSLLVAARPEAASTLRQAAEHHGIPLHEIGELVPATEGFTMADENGVYPLPSFDVDELARIMA